VLKNIESVIARSEATCLSCCHSIVEIASLSLAMTRTGLFQQALTGLPHQRTVPLILYCEGRCYSELQLCASVPRVGILAGSVQPQANGVGPLSHSFNLVDDKSFSLVQPSAGNRCLWIVHDPVTARPVRPVSIGGVGRSDRVFDALVVIRNIAQVIKWVMYTIELPFTNCRDA